MHINDFMASDELTPGNFEGKSWAAWRSILAATFGLPPADPELFTRLAGGRSAPTERVRELWAIAGRRSGKTNATAGIAVYLATIGAAVDGLLDKLAPGERGVVALLAVDRQQAKVALRYIAGMFEASPVLAQMVVKRDAEALHLDNRISIEVSTNNYRSVRGRTLLAAVLDEVAFFRDDQSANPDVETYRAILPGLATTGGLLVGISSPYAKRGLLYQKWRKHYGQDGDILVIQGATPDFNPTIPTSVITDAEADDPAAARAEWFGLFRDDVEGFLTREVVEACTRPSPLVIPYNRENIYTAFADPAGGGRDEFCLAIGHQEGEVVVVDNLQARRGAPAKIVAEYADLLKAYNVQAITADRYAGSWPADEFARHGITCNPAANSKSVFYLDALAAFNSGRLQLPPDDMLLNQLTALERRTARGGRDSIDHPPGGHDDRANVVAGLAAQPQGAIYDVW